MSKDIAIVFLYFTLSGLFLHVCLKNINNVVGNDGCQSGRTDWNG